MRFSNSNVSALFFSIALIDKYHSIPLMVHLSWFFNSSSSGACNFMKKETLTQVFSCEFFKISKNTFFCRTIPVDASVEFSVHFEFSMISFPDITSQIFLWKDLVSWSLLWYKLEYKNFGGFTFKFILFSRKFMSNLAFLTLRDNFSSLLSLLIGSTCKWCKKRHKCHKWFCHKIYLFSWSNKKKH